MKPPTEGAALFRGELWWADLPEPVGSEPGYRRPVLIIQINRFNRSRLATVLAVSVTTNLALAGLPGNVSIPALTAGLVEDSVVNVTQVVTMDRTFLGERIGTLSAELLRRVEDGLRLIQGL
ncbi:type II toxin-antitoxin system PemK/MazF family toxin [Deinococcus sp. SM5_A1]|uniref:type II toxin-antitoxin system PemK/MazF family toxin n=1 Tax=Deinococcus sp. SM5_A1 TaxID=3379094 RepID=UPI00385B62C3